jgi:hypothetical protein
MGTDWGSATSAVGSEAVVPGTPQEVFARMHMHDLLCVAEERHVIRRIRAERAAKNAGHVSVHRLAAVGRQVAFRVLGLATYQSRKAT